MLPLTPLTPPAQPQPGPNSWMGSEVAQILNLRKQHIETIVLSLELISLIVCNT